MRDPSAFFIGWSADIPRADRRFMLGAGLALVAAGGGLGAALALQRPPVGGGVWDMGQVYTLRGVMSREPYPVLRTIDLGEGMRTVFLATSGKNAPHLPAALAEHWVEVAGTLIERGRNAMLALADIKPAAGEAPEGLRAPPQQDLGEALMTGEILDAKCWFGAMRPSYGKTHKACAALCARGGLPLAFCQTSACGTGLKAPLLLDADGRAHSERILPLVADPVLAEGRLVQVGDVMQLRVSLDAIRRL